MRDARRAGRGSRAGTNHMLPSFGRPIGRPTGCYCRIHMMGSSPDQVPSSHATGPDVKNANTHAHGWLTICADRTSSRAICVCRAITTAAAVPRSASLMDAACAQKPVACLVTGPNKPSTTTWNSSPRREAGGHDHRAAQHTQPRVSGECDQVHPG